MTVSVFRWLLVTVCRGSIDSTFACSSLLLMAVNGSQWLSVSVSVESGYMLTCSPTTEGDCWLKQLAASGPRPMAPVNKCECECECECECSLRAMANGTCQ